MPEQRSRRVRPCEAKIGPIFLLRLDTAVVLPVRSSEPKTPLAFAIHEGNCIGKRRDVPFWHYPAVKIVIKRK